MTAKKSKAMLKSKLVYLPSLRYTVIMNKGYVFGDCWYPFAHNTVRVYNLVEKHDTIRVNMLLYPCVIISLRFLCTVDRHMTNLEYRKRDHCEIGFFNILNNFLICQLCYERPSIDHCFINKTRWWIVNKFSSRKSLKRLVRK